MGTMPCMKAGTKTSKGMCRYVIEASRYAQTAQGTMNSRHPRACLRVHMVSACLTMKGPIAKESSGQHSLDWLVTLLSPPVNVMLVERDALLPLPAQTHGSPQQLAYIQWGRPGCPGKANSTHTGVWDLVDLATYVPQLGLHAIHKRMHMHACGSALTPLGPGTAHTWDNHAAPGGSRSTIMGIRAGTIEGVFWLLSTKPSTATNE